MDSSRRGDGRRGEGRRSRYAGHRGGDDAVVQRRRAGGVGVALGLRILGRRGRGVARRGRRLVPGTRPTRGAPTHARGGLRRARETRPRGLRGRGRGRGAAGRRAVASSPSPRTPSRRRRPRRPADLPACAGDADGSERANATNATSGHASGARPEAAATTNGVSGDAPFVVAADAFAEDADDAKKYDADDGSRSPSHTERDSLSAASDSTNSTAVRAATPPGRPPAPLSRAEFMAKMEAEWNAIGEGDGGERVAASPPPPPETPSSSSAAAALLGAGRGRGHGEDEGSEGEVAVKKGDEGDDDAKAAAESSPTRKIRSGSSRRRLGPGPTRSVRREKTIPPLATRSARRIRVAATTNLKMTTMSPLLRPPVCLAAWASTRARESSPPTRTRVFGETRETSRRGASRRPPRSRFSGPSRTSLCARSRTHDLTARSSSGARRLSARVSAECPSEWAAATRAQRRESQRRGGKKKKKKKSPSFEAAPLRGRRKRRRRGWTSPPAAGPRCSGTRGRDAGGRRTRGRPPGRKTIFIPDDRAIRR